MRIEDAEQDMRRVLEKYTTPQRARLVMEHARAGSELGSVSAADDESLERIVECVETSARYYVDGPDHDRMSNELREISAPCDGPRELDLPISNRHEVRRARLLSRTLCGDLGLAPLVVLRVVSGITELTENILHHAGSGSLMVVALEETRRVRVIARDSGPGIADIDAVLGGQCSRGTKVTGLADLNQTADSLEVETGPQGTTVTFEIAW